MKTESRQFRKAFSFGIIFLLISFLSACGFQLRGAYQLPSEMAVIHIQAANPNSELVRALTRSLKASDIQMSDSMETAQAVLKIFNEKQSKRTISVDSRGRAREYALMYSVSFSVAAKDSDFKITEQKLRLERDFLFDTEDVLGKGREEAVLMKDMQHDTVRLIMLRLEAKANRNGKD